MERVLAAPDLDSSSGTTLPSPRDETSRDLRTGPRSLLEAIARLAVPDVLRGRARPEPCPDRDPWPRSRPLRVPAEMMRCRYRSRGRASGRCDRVQTFGPGSRTVPVGASVDSG